MNCENCGKLLNNADVIISFKNGESVNIFCKECSKTFGHCPMCQYNIPCGFLNDPDPMPQFIMKTWQRNTPIGTQVIQKQIPNAERVKKFCIEGKCKCYNESDDRPLCCRIGGYATCTNYTEAK